MARPLKKGIDYFSHDVNMKDDIKIKLLRAKYGITGYAIYNLLLEDIYKNGYFLVVDEDYILIFCSDNNIETELFNSIVEFMISRQLFSEIIYKNYGILTSKRIQSDYLHATSKRTDNNVIDKKLDVDIVILEKTNVISEKTPVNYGDNTHSIEEKSIEEESIEKKRIELETDFNNFWNLYDKKVGDKSKVVKKFNNLTIKDKEKIFETLPEYIKSTPDKQYRKNPETYLNNHSWNDEIIIQNTNGTIKPRRNTLQDF
jgi:hypothetical protein